MRPTGTSPVLKARAIAGSYVVVLAWDVVSGQQADLAGCLGFAIERTAFGQAGAVAESYWMRSIKRFQDKDQGLPPCTPVFIRLLSPFPPSATPPGPSADRR